MATSESSPVFNTSADQLHSDAPRQRTKPGVFADQNGNAGGGARDQSPAEPASPPAPARLSQRRRPEAQTAAPSSRHTWLGPLLVVAAFLTAYALNPTPSNPAHRFIFLSYPEGLEPTTQPGYRSPRRLYGKGLRDLALVAFYAVVLTFTREFFMHEVFRPLARAAGLPPARRTRLMEQAYAALYFGLAGPAGLYVMRRTPVWYFDTRGMFEGYPHHSQEGVVKFYYLFQAAYWAQQAVVLLLGMEKPRKDFRELVAHHVVTLALIATSYRFHFTYIGLAVFPTHDISDFFLATSKMLKYLDSILLVPYYTLFMVCWIYLRHYLNIRVILSLFTDFKDVGPYYLDWPAGQFKCDKAFYVTLSLLSSLQALNLFWFLYIVRIAWRFVWFSEAEDVRSEGEGEGEDEDEKEDRDEEEEEKEEEKEKQDVAR